MVFADRADAGRRPAARLEHLRGEQVVVLGNELVCVDTPEAFFAIGQFYSDFSQVGDKEVIACLESAASLTQASPAPADAPAAGADPPSTRQEVEVSAGAVRLAGHLALPGKSAGIVLFAHASASSRHSPRSRYLALILNQAGIGTLLIDLLTPDEEMDPASVFDIGLLAGRLAGATRWVRAQPGASGLPVGYLGTRTAAAAALWAAAEPGNGIAAVVSRGGRPDLAGTRLAAVQAPTLLIVAARDDVLVRFNRQAQAELRCDHRLALVPGATSLFRERGTLAAAAELALDWFTSHLVPSPGTAT
jgi:putative phosphoribosyl transferase